MARPRRVAIVLLLGCGAFIPAVAVSAAAAQGGPGTQGKRLARIQYERIVDFYSEIEVRSDATMVVTETIRVISLQNQIRHGIYRDFPTRYADRFGNRYVVGFDLLGATRDGEPEPSRVEDYAKGKRIYLGRSDVLLSSGEHTYSIAYTTNRQIGFFSDHDELFWNVTGNGWGFTIEHASATVHLPSNIPAKKVQIGGYTGRQGSMASELTSSTNSEGSFQFETTRELPPHNGLTIRLSFPKGYMAPPTTNDLIRYFAEDNRDSVIALAGFAVLILYYLAAWAYAGRDPKEGTIVVQYEPPRDFSPAAIRYLVKMGYDNKAFAAAVIDMAVRGFLTIKQEDGTYTLYRTKTDNRVLSPDEKAAADKLFGDGRTEIWVHNENHTTIGAAIAAMKRGLKTAEQKIYFVANGAYMVPGLFVSALTLLALVSSEGPGKMAMAAFVCVWLTIWSLGVFGLVATAVHLWKSAFEGGTIAAGSMGQAVIVSIFSIPFLGGEVMGLWFLTKALSTVAGLVLIGTIIVHIVFHQLLKAPTRAGRTVLDKIEGFKMFLGAVEGDRMGLDAANRTPQMFEKFLPYALSLDFERAWASNFAGVLDGAARVPGGNSSYSPTWYSGSNWGSLGATGFATSLGSSFSGAVSSSATAPGSSGGGGGGSGGGGGGGGGGGW